MEHDGGKCEKKNVCVCVCVRERERERLGHFAEVSQQKLVQHFKSTIIKK